MARLFDYETPVFLVTHRTFHHSRLVRLFDYETNVSLAAHSAFLWQRIARLFSCETGVSLLVSGAFLWRGDIGGVVEGIGARRVCCLLVFYESAVGCIMRAWKIYFLMRIRFLFLILTG